MSSDPVAQHLDSIPADGVADGEISVATAAADAGVTDDLYRAGVAIREAIDLRHANNLQVADDADGS